jgi:hypothetical protein
MAVDTFNSTNVTCNGESNGTATIAVSGGISPYTFEWSTGTSTTNSVSNLTAGTYTVTVKDALNKVITKEFTISEPTLLEIISNNEAVTIYKGYAPTSCTTLLAGTVTGGAQPYTYLWSNGATTKSIAVCPTETTVYTLTVKDANGCTSSIEKAVNVKDVSCGNNPKSPKVEICHNGKTICVDANAVQSHLAHGDFLGSCDSVIADVKITQLNVFPNPFVTQVTVEINSSSNAKVDFQIYNFFGQMVSSSSYGVISGQSTVNLDLSNLGKGFYFLKTVVNGEIKNIKYLVKN